MTIAILEKPSLNFEALQNLETLNKVAFLQEEAKRELERLKTGLNFKLY